MKALRKLIWDQLIEIPDSQDFCIVVDYDDCTYTVFGHISVHYEKTRATPDGLNPEWIDVKREAEIWTIEQYDPNTESTIKINFTI